MPSSLAFPPVEYCRGTIHDQPCSKIASLPKGCAVADGSNDGGGHDRPDPQNLPDASTLRIGGGDPFQLQAESFNLVLDYFPLLPKKIDEVPHLGCQVKVSVLKNVGQRGPQHGWSLRENQASLEQKRTPLVDDRRASRDQAIPNSMDGLQVELIIGLDRDEAHVLALNGFGDRLRIHEVVLVGLYERFNKLRCYQAHIMALLA
jgi:hypothetical protein